MRNSGYPETVTEVLDDSARFKPAALRALREFRRSRPWRGSVEEREEKFRTLNHALAGAYGIREPELVVEALDGTTSGRSHYTPALHRIVLSGKLSVVTYLHEFAHARGMGERGAARWSINLFRRIFPGEYGRLIHVGHMLVRAADIAPRGSGESAR
jgi:hypothetical protein